MGTLRARYGHKEEQGNKETIRKNIRAVADRTDDAFEEFWKAYPKRDGANPKAPSRKKFLAWVKSGTDPAVIIAGAKRYASEVRSKGQERTPYVAQAITWLNQQRFDDYRPPPSAAPNAPPPGVPSDEELRKRYGNPALSTKTQSTNGIGADLGGELQRSGFDVRPSLRKF